jgi:ubiquinone/menaquinone biosynthesis C-methylase UbiE
MDSHGFFEKTSDRYASETLGDVRTTRSLHRQFRTEAVLDLIGRYARPSGTIADIGCGPAQMAEPLLARGFGYVGIDPVPAMFRTMQRMLDSEPRANFLVGDAEALPLADESVDALAVIGVIEYLRDDVAWLSEARRVIAPGGIVVVSFPNLLNPAQALRALTRPVIAPLIRAVAPRRRAVTQTVYAGRVFHRPFVPWGRFSRFRTHGFRLAEVVYTDFCLHLRSRPLRDGEAGRHRKRQAMGARHFPWLGADVVCCIVSG